jgi:hypothetical protein
VLRAGGIRACLAEGRRYDRHVRTTAELREGFLSFFEERDHLRFPSFPLIPPT